MRLLLVLAVLAALSGCVAAQPRATRSARPVEPAPGAATAPVRVTPTDLARLIHAEANTARARFGRRSLGERDDLAALALAQSRDMVARDFFDHTNPDGLDHNARARRAGVRCTRPVDAETVRLGVLENLFQTWIARRTTTVHTGTAVRRIAHVRSPDVIAREVIDGWLDSPGHRRALLDASAADQGIGVVIRPDGAIFVTEVIC